jgi:imidazolonepropionase-like amidohydrolase
VIRLLLGALALLWPATALAETVVVRADRMVDVVTARVVERPMVVITDGRIRWIGNQHEVAPDLPAEARQIDLAGQTLLPGLIDMHVHLDSNANYHGYRGLEFTDLFWAVQGVGHARAMLEAGFTTVRNLGSSQYADVGYRQAIDEGLMVGPRIVPAGNALGATGGHCDNNMLPPSYEGSSDGVGDGPQALIRLVREQRRYGAEVIKICATGGVMSKNTEPGQQQLSLEEMTAVAEEAHRLGLRVAAHAHGADGIRDAIRAGIDTIEHASLIDDAGIRLARERGAALTMDIYVTDWILSEGEAAGMLPESLDKERIVGEAQRESFRRAHQAGVRILFGTDAGVYPHGLGGRQLPVMVRYGMTPMQAIQSATVHAAEALNRSADVGAIAVGRYGDLVAVAGDPLSDIDLLSRVSVVIKGGDVVADRR